MTRLRKPSHCYFIEWKTETSIDDIFSNKDTVHKCTKKDPKQISGYEPFFTFDDQYYCHCVKVVQIQSFLVRIFPYLDWIQKFTEEISVFSPNTGKYGPGKLRIWTLFMKSVAMEEPTRLPFSLFLFFFFFFEKQSVAFWLVIRYSSYWSSSPEMFCKKGALRIFAKSTAKHLSQSLRPANLLKNRLWHRWFPVNFGNTFFYRVPLMAASVPNI